MSRHYTADGLLYALDIENGSLQDIVDPTHLALHPIGWTWYQLWRAFGWSSGSIFPLGALNALAGGICVGLVMIIARRLSVSPITSMLIAIGFAASGATWLLSVESEFVTVPLVSSLLVLYLLIGSPASIRNSRYYTIALGVVTGLAILMYANNVFLLLVVGVVLWIRRGPPVKEQIATITSYLRPLIFLVVPVIAVGFWFWTDGNWSMASQLRESDSYGRFAWLNIPRGIYAFMRTIALYRGLAMNDSTELFLREARTIEKSLFFFYYGMVAVVTSIPIILGLRFRASLMIKYRFSFIALVIWSTFYALFAFAWVPSDISFWIPLLVTWWLLVCMLLTVLPAASGESRKAMQLLIGIFITILMVANATMVILPRRDLSTNKYYQIARDVNHQTDSGDIVIADESKLETIFLAYFSDRIVFPVDFIEMEETDLDFVSAFLASGDSAQQGQAYLFNNGSLTEFDP